LALEQERRWHPHRLRNTDRPLADLARSETVLLLDNAFVDTTASLEMPIPAHLRAQAEAGTYLVQFRAGFAPAGRARAEALGLAVISYIPHNGLLVAGERATVDMLARDALVQAALPFEPYFRLAGDLLPLALESAPLSPEQWLHATAVPGQAEALRLRLQALGAVLGAEEETPFGRRFTLLPPKDTWLDVVRDAAVHRVESAQPRALANDLTRARLGVAVDTVVTNNYLDLTGSNVLVNINDSGVDVAHPDLKGRVFTSDTNVFTLADPEGHGTHVAGIIASDGQSSDTVTNAPGSLTNASYRGMAPAAKLFVLPIDLKTGPLVSDRFLLETAARTNALISNNSWFYPLAFSYNSSSAQFDAATRDALPDAPGDQPLLFVFCAGNYGDGNDTGYGGRPGVIPAPANAKNAITVGALESYRNLTNSSFTTNVIVGGSESVTNVVTNFFFLGITDSDDEVASYSSRGNVGLGTEGQFGRFKPDVVAPGTFMISTRSEQWSLDTNLPNAAVLNELNEGLGRRYRFETGTSMSAPAISGLLALVQEFFEQRLKVTNSPALMKALLINAARSLSSGYNLSPQNYINYQGWGLPDLTRMLPVSLTNLTAQALTGTSTPAEGGDTNQAPPVVPGLDLERQRPLPVRLIDQNPTNAVATGQNRSWRLSLNDDTRLFPLRMTLVWTDPPGNPAASIKLVNDLDLVVTNLDTGEVFFGNDIPTASDFNRPFLADEGTTEPRDIVNNVENVFLREPLGTNYSISVRGHRINVNAVAGNTNDVVQDFALVISTDNLALTNAFTSFTAETLLPTRPPVTVLTNGVAILNQRSGANFPLTDNRSGQAAQWSFYVFTNTYDVTAVSAITNGTNVAFITFLPPNVSRPRALEADIDMYVSTNAAITNLEPVAMATAFREIGRGGSQVVFFTNAVPGAVYYIGVKAEDQQSVEYGLVGLSSDLPFDSTDSEGYRVLRGFPASVTIPDGSPERPGVSFLFAIGTMPMTVARARVSTEIIHQQIGDLLGNLSHNDHFVVLNNHFADLTQGWGGTNFVFEYDDSDSGFGSYSSRRSDGPGSLMDFMGDEGSGVWMLTMVDNALTHTGLVQNVFVRVLPIDYDLAKGVDGTVLANRFAFYTVDVPADATRMTVSLSQMTGPLDLYVRRGRAPTFDDYDYYAELEPPTNTFSFGVRDVPPLVAGRYFIGVYNPGANTVNFNIRIELDRNLRDDAREGYGSADTPLALADQALTTSTLFVPSSRPVVNARIGLRVDHPRVSDLAVRLVSPQGTRLLLVENRGGLAPTGFGAGDALDMVYTAFTDDTELTEEPIKFAVPPFSAAPAGSVALTRLATGFDTLPLGPLQLGSTNDGWRVVGFDGTTNLPPLGTPFTPAEILATQLAPTPSNVLALGTCRIAGEFVAVPGRTYSIQFLYRSVAPGPLAARVFLNGALTGIVTASTNEWQTFVKLFVSARGINTLDIGPALAQPGLLIDSISLFESGGFTYYLPEERMKPWEGESALGNWRLEVDDTRAGPESAFEAQLINWQLQLLLAPTNPPAITLTNHVPYDGVVIGDEIQYFMVNVPRRVDTVTNWLVGDGDLVLLYSSSGLPTGTYPDDVRVNNAGVGGLETLILRTNVPPELKPGQRYYLGVANADTNATTSFRIRIDYAAVIADLLNLPRLTNDVPVTNTLGAGPALNYYQFVVSTNAWQARFQLTPVDGNVDLFLKRGRPVPDPLPTPDDFDYAAISPGTNPEEIVVNIASSPVPLAPGRWYIGVANVDTQAVTYVLRVMEEPAPPIVVLTDGVAISDVAPADGFVEKFYLLPVAATNAVLRFDLFDLSGPADLFLARNRFVTPLDYDYLVVSPDGRAARLFVDPASGSATEGNWFAAVASRDANPLTFSLRASILTDTNAVVTELDSGVAVVTYVFGSPQTPDIEWFSITVSDQAKAFDVFLQPIDGDVDLYLRRGAPPTFPPGPEDYYSTNPGLANERVRLIRDLPGALLEPGEWFIAVVNRDPYPVKFLLRATEFSSAGLIPLAENVGVTNLALAGQSDRYQLTVGPEGEALFVLLSMLDADTISELHLSMLSADTNRLDPEVEGVPDGVTAEVITLRTNSAPVALTPGDWIVTVTNRATSAQLYAISFFVDHATEPEPGFLRPGLEVTNQSVCLSWPSAIGTNYAVQGKTSWTNTAENWSTLVANLAATDTNTTHCVSWLEPYRYFRVLIGGMPDIVDTNVVINPDVVVTNGNFCLTWSSSAGAEYRLESKTNLVEAQWLPAGSTITATASQTTQCLPLTSVATFYRVVLLRGPVIPPPASTNQPVQATATLENGRFCLRWDTVAGRSYQVERKALITDVAWSVVAPPILASGSTLSYCADLSSEQFFYQVVELGAAPSVPVPDPALQATLAADGRKVLSWEAAPGRSYEILVSADLITWTVQSVITATSSRAEAVLPPAGEAAQFFRVRLRP
jgi:subtilisin-like proprotein convertase family protein